MPFPSTTRVVGPDRSTICNLHEKLRASPRGRSHILCDQNGYWVVDTADDTRTLAGRGRRLSWGGTRGRTADRPPRRLLARPTQDVPTSVRGPAGQVQELGRQGGAGGPPARQVLRGLRDRRRVAGGRPAAA